MLKALINKLFSTETIPSNTNTTVIIQPQKIYLLEPNQQELDEIISSPNLEGKAPGYVYFVQEHMNGTFKIGKTKHLAKRMNVFTVKLPFENQLIYLIKSGNHHQTEMAFHKHFANKRLEGEWFNLNKDDITWIKGGKYTPEINQTINVHFKTDNEKQKILKNDIHQDKPLTEKQIEYAKNLIKRLEKEHYVLIVEYTTLTNTDLNRMSVYFKYKNIGALNNLVKSGILKKIS